MLKSKGLLLSAHAIETNAAGGRVVKDGEHAAVAGEVGQWTPHSRLELGFELNEVRGALLTQEVKAKAVRETTGAENRRGGAGGCAHTVEAGTVGRMIIAHRH